MLVTWYTRIFNKQFCQQNLATPEFLVKCLLLTVSLLSSRKQYEYGKHTGKTIYWQGILSKIIYGNDVSGETYPSPVPHLKICSQGPHLWIAPKAERQRPRPNWTDFNRPTYLWKDKFTNLCFNQLALTLALSFKQGEKTIWNGS